MSEYKNSRKDALFLRLPTTSIESKEDNITEKCKFNFHYMDFSQRAGQNFQDWENDNQPAKLLNKLKYYCEKPLKHWTYQKIGSGAKRGNILEIYGKFPNESDFTHPKHVPHEALWARFRLEWDARLIGFVIPNEYNGRRHDLTNQYYDCNTFYIVFLDKEHKFCKSEK